ncbi:MAG: glucose-6-phosphate isomerase [Xanthomonadales bacterium]|nr:glucose-6-phosphate isomerase [Xanthomonadales bacterium]
MSAALLNHWDTLKAQADRLLATPLAGLASGADHVSRCMLTLDNLHFVFARQRIDQSALERLLALAGDAGVQERLQALMDGETVNTTESRAALHSALRFGGATGASAKEARAAALEVRVRMELLTEQLAASAVTDIVSVGIGGSDLGPRLVVDALREHHEGRFRVHFIGNVDGSGAHRLLPTLDPKRTAVILVSKSFSTQETHLNGQILRQWLGDDSRFFAVTSKPQAAAEIGVAPERILPMWDWVGGRYSLWSAVGWSARLALGADRWDALLEGAAALDAHALNAPLAKNLPVLHGLLAIWNRNFLGYASHAILPYDERLGLLPDHLQQVVMESLGKSVRHDGTPVTYETVPVLWGGTGTSSQHSFFQALHQGTEVVPADFIGVVRPDHPHRENHQALLANLLAQMEALASGSQSDNAHRCYAGGRPSSLILLDSLDPYSLGMLLALYEHSVFVQSVLWGINAFDQWGVELGKRLANELLPALRGEGEAGDAISRELVKLVRGVALRS